MLCPHYYDGVVLMRVHNVCLYGKQNKSQILSMEYLQKKQYRFFFPTFCPPSQLGSTLKGKNLLPLEQILSYKSWPNF